MKQEEEDDTSSSALAGAALGNIRSSSTYADTDVPLAVVCALEAPASSSARTCIGFFFLAVLRLYYMQFG